MSDRAAEAKKKVAYCAADLVESGMNLGLGSGSTFCFALDRLAERIRKEGLEITGVATSRGTAERAHELGIPLTSLEDVEQLDLTIDGADEVGPDKTLIKGGGAALTREKIVAAASRELIVIVHEAKMVDVLGSTFPLPVEVLPFGWKQAARQITALGCTVSLREVDGRARITDNGNYVLDCKFDRIDDPAGLSGKLSIIPGVVEHGLFVGMAGRILVASEKGEVAVR